MNLSPTNYFNALPGLPFTSCSTLPLVQSGQRVLELTLAPDGNLCGLWVPARVFPERTSNLESGLSVGLVVSTNLSIGMISTADDENEDMIMVPDPDPCQNCQSCHQGTPENQHIQHGEHDML